MVTLDDVDMTRTETRSLIGRFYSRAQFIFVSSGVAGAQVLQQPSKSKQFIPSGIRDGAIQQIPRPPEPQVIPVANGVLRQAALIRRPTEDVDDVRTTLEMTTDARWCSK